jgi:hydrogenase maturation protease
MRPILMAGLGNPLLTDEGVAVHVIRRLDELTDHFPEVEFVDLGTAALRAVHLMQGRRKAVFIDCAFMGEPPGTIRRFVPEDVRSIKQLQGVSLHEGDLLKAICIARELGQCAEEIVIFGIQPASIEPGEQLSQDLAERMDTYVERLTEELRDAARGK